MHDCDDRIAPDRRAGERDGRGRNQRRDPVVIRPTVRGASSVEGWIRRADSERRGESPHGRHTMRRAQTAWIAAGLAAIFIGSPARSRPTLDSWDWATVGDPGNRGTTDDENGIYFTDQTVIGGVDSRYRMAVTEVTVGQYIGFAQVTRRSTANGRAALGASRPSPASISRSRAPTRGCIRDAMCRLTSRSR